MNESGNKQTVSFCGDKVVREREREREGEVGGGGRKLVVWMSQLHTIMNIA